MPIILSPDNYNLLLNVLWVVVSMNKVNYLIVTCRPGNEDWCEEEIGNIIFELDPNIVIEKTKFKGVLLVKTKADLDRVFTRIRSYEYGFVERVIPLHDIIMEPDEGRIVNAVMNLVPKGVESVCLRINLRGIRGLSSRLWKLIRASLARRGITVSSNAKYCILVESVGGLIGVSVLKRGEDRVHKG